MKNKILLLLLLPLLFGCNDWLNVTPESEVDEEDLFVDGEGYRNALNGIYSRISKTNMYAQQMTWGFMDVVARYYDYNMMNKYGAYPKAYNGDYNSVEVKNVLEGIWTGAYTAIANCNNLIQNIEKEDRTMFLGLEEEQNMIKGEALALRAFLHFDLLRLFAPTAMKVNEARTEYVPSNDNNVYLPYCDSHPAMFQQRENVKDFLDKVVRDLLEAKTLLATFDTISDIRKNQLATKERFLATSGNVQGDLFYCFRGFRLNYYAVTAILARVYNYKGELKLAAEQAQEVIDYGAFKPVLSSDPKRYDDIIFALSNKKLIEYFNTYYTGDNKLLALPKTQINVITGGDPYDMDYRLSYHLRGADGSTMVCLKYQSGTLGTIADEIIPMIRTCEMQYIVGEYYASIGEYSTAASRLTKERNTWYCFSTVSVKSLENYHNAWLNDAYRSFIGEGQLFYLYKKLGVKIYPEMKEGAFVFAIPDSENVLLN